MKVEIENIEVSGEPSKVGVNIYGSNKKTSVKIYVSDIRVAQQIMEWLKNFEVAE